jgi:hypothetical protein
MSHIKERQQELQPGRTEYAITRLRSLGYPVIEINATPYNLRSGGSRLRCTHIPVGLREKPLKMDGELRTY